MIRILLSTELGKRRWSQADLARMTGIRASTIGDYYNELTDRINLRHFELICKALDCDQTTKIERYDRLMDFGKKHLPDKFFLEDDVNKSLRNIILREMISNVLMHREFTNSYTAKFVIEKERMYVENANRAASDKYITEDNLEDRKSVV